MDVKTEQYKDYTIEIHPQPKTGDNVKVYIGVWKNNKKVFGMWEKISGTESRNITIKETTELLEKKGTNRTKRMLDNNSFENGKEYSFWEAVR